MVVLLLFLLIGCDTFLNDEHALQADFEAIAHQHQHYGVILAVAEVWSVML